MMEIDDTIRSKKIKAVEQLLRDTGIYLGRALHLGICTEIAIQESYSEKVIKIEYDPQHPNSGFYLSSGKLNVSSLKEKL